MAVKHVVEYYNEITEQYLELLENIRDFEAEAEKGLVEPERLDKIKENIQPLLNNYQTLSYIMYLLNKPVKKSKQGRYRNQSKKQLSKIEKQFTKDGLIKTGEETLKQIKRIINKTV